MSVTTGLLGLGKIISSCRSNPSEWFDMGATKANGEITRDVVDFVI